MNTLERIILLGGLAFFIGCSSTRTVENYVLPENPEYNAEYYFEADASRASLIETLNNVKASGLIDPTYLPRIEELTFDIDARDTIVVGDTTAYYMFSHDYIMLFATGDQGQGSRTASMIHELTHDYWFNFLSDEKVSGFKDEIRNYVSMVQEISEQVEKIPLTDGWYRDGDAQEAITKKCGLTLWEYQNLQFFFEHKKPPEDLYSDSFETEAFFTEAYAYILGDEIDNKLTDLLILDIKTGSILDGFENERSRESLQIINHIPANLLPFYEGFLAEKYTNPSSE